MNPRLHQLDVDRQEGLIGPDHCLEPTADVKHDERGVELQPNPREGGHRRGKEVWKEEEKSLAQAAQVCCGGQTLMMPQCGCQQGHSQQAEGNVSASVETIRLLSSSSSSSSHGCTSAPGLQECRRKEGKKLFHQMMTNRILSSKFAQLTALLPAELHTLLSWLLSPTPSKGEIFANNRQRWAGCGANCQRVLLNTHARLQVGGQDPGFQLPPQQFCGCDMLRGLSVRLAPWLCPYMSPNTAAPRGWRLISEVWCSGGGGRKWQGESSPGNTSKLLISTCANNASTGAQSSAGAVEVQSLWKSFTNPVRGVRPGSSLG